MAGHFLQASGVYVQFILALLLVYLANVYGTLLCAKSWVGYCYDGEPDMVWLTFWHVGALHTVGAEQVCPKGMNGWAFMANLKMITVNGLNNEVAFINYVMSVFLE